MIHVRRWREAEILWVGLPLGALVLGVLAISEATRALDAMTSSYLYAESRWSKAQKVSVGYALRYLQSRSQADLDAASSSLDVIDAFRDARVAMMAPTLDYHAADAAFARAGVPAEQRRLMILGPRYLRMPLVESTLQTWRIGDETIQSYRETLALLPEQVKRERGRMLLAASLRDLDLELTDLENRFSEKLLRVEAYGSAIGRWLQWGVGALLVVIWSGVGGALPTHGTAPKTDAGRAGTRPSALQDGRRSGADCGRDHRRRTSTPLFESCARPAVRVRGRTDQSQGRAPRLYAGRRTPQGIARCEN